LTIIYIKYIMYCDFNIYGKEIIMQSRLAELAPGEKGAWLLKKERALGPNVRAIKAKPMTTQELGEPKDPNAARQINSDNIGAIGHARQVQRRALLVSTGGTGFGWDADGNGVGVVRSPGSVASVLGLTELSYISAYRSGDTTLSSSRSGVQMGSPS
jgi:hypothetical protein